jgi:hypothetical protein
MPGDDDVRVGARADAHGPCLEATALGIQRYRRALLIEPVEVVIQAVPARAAYPAAEEHAELDDVASHVDQPIVSVPMHEQEPLPVDVERPLFWGGVHPCGDQVVVAMDVGVAGALETACDVGVALARFT